MTDDDAAFGEQILNVAEAEVEPKVQSDGVGDDVGGKRSLGTASGRMR